MMKLLSIVFTFIFISFSARASHIVLSAKIKSNLQKKITKDLELLDNFQFRDGTDLKTLRVLGIDNLTAFSASEWLNDRVKYIVEENAFSSKMALLKKRLYVQQENVHYPSPLQKQLPQEEKSTVSSSIMMTNIGAEIYIKGKEEHKLYGVKISSTLSKKSIHVSIESPRSGILQIGPTLFAPELAINRKDEKAISNSIFRLAFFFHEARHSDGNGPSLGFKHYICPKGHDYEGELACDKSLNGAYSVGAVMAKEMMLSCDVNCTERDKEMLKIFIMDNYNRVQLEDQGDQKAQYWDISPEKL